MAVWTDFLPNRVYVNSKIRIVLAHTDPEVCKTVRDAVEEADYHLSDVIESCDDLRRLCLETRPDIVISGIKLSDGDAVPVLVEVGHVEPLPAIIITDRDSLADVERSLQDHVMAYLVTPLDADQIKPTIYLVIRRFEQFEQLRHEVEDLKQALTNRKIIERAKGILMGNAEIDEAEAFSILQRKATDQRQKLVKVAAAIVDAHEGKCGK
ncbi:putative transcriptional regulatory protein pdtaR [Botrimarina colliarenosi]|uniref:Putative transcriptional regulatory protein pdtaR n=1 Tax=Botrimarina colliarenosi TaxID=2528001 RepID=A0A5C6AMD3_9BACT|nr:ANTAR domain-containing protein [Botrimarina colliarenosi]TWU00637.1 putative transcriptional regulatory protein pdtaR [Botrimarina colliarenosi]